MKKRRIVLPAAAFLAIVISYGWTTYGDQLRTLVVTIEKLGMADTLDLMRGKAGEVGMLANGSSDTSIELAEGVRVPARIGKHPLPRKPLPPLPMPDHPYLLDELNSAGIHADSYNSAVSALPGPLGEKPIATVEVVLEGYMANCTPMLRHPSELFISTCISFKKNSELVLFDPANNYKVLARQKLPMRAYPMQPAGGWQTRLDHLGRAIVPTADQRIIVYDFSEDGGSYEWNTVREYSLASVLAPPISAMDIIPSWDGHYWIMSGWQI